MSNDEILSKNDIDNINHRTQRLSSRSNYGYLVGNANRNDHPGSSNNVNGSNGNQGGASASTEPSLYVPEEKAFLVYGQTSAIVITPDGHDEQTFTLILFVLPGPCESVSYYPSKLKVYVKQNKSSTGKYRISSLENRPIFGYIIPGIHTSPSYRIAVEKYRSSSIETETTRADDLPSSSGSHSTTPSRSSNASIDKSAEQPQTNVTQRRSRNHNACVRSHQPSIALNSSTLRFFRPRMPGELNASQQGINQRSSCTLQRTVQSSLTRPPTSSSSIPQNLSLRRPPENPENRNGHRLTMFFTSNQSSVTSSGSLSASQITPRSNQSQIGTPRQYLRRGRSSLNHEPPNQQTNRSRRSSRR